jgi:hypothetical protein
MFLSDAQLDLLDRAKEKPLDLLEVHVSTASSLTSRGLATINYSLKVGTPTTFALTGPGSAIAAELSSFRRLPNYRDILIKSSRTKQVLRKRRGY